MGDAGQKPFSAPHAVAIAYSLLFVTEQITEACRNWKRTLSPHKMSDNFKIDLGLAFKELHESQQTAHGAGFAPQNANHAVAIEESTAETAEAIGNLASVAGQTQVIVQALVVTNTTITQNLIEANQHLAEALITIAPLEANGEGLQFGGRGPGRGRGGGRGGGGGRGSSEGRGINGGG